MADTSAGRNEQKRRGGFVKGVIPPGAKPFVKGQSGNPAGISAHQRELQKAAEEACTPEKVKQVMDAMFRAACGDAENRPDTAAAKIWLDRGLGAVKEAPVDLTDAPQEVLAYLKDKIN